MLAARMYGYKEPLRLEELPGRPDVSADEVLVEVAAAGLCRSDFQLMDGYFSESLPVSFPITPGREVAGTITEVVQEPSSPDSL
jgi:alcohol dehydrogenase, propanol-preferring